MVAFSRMEAGTSCYCMDTFLHEDLTCKHGSKSKIWYYRFELMLYANIEDRVVCVLTVIFGREQEIDIVSDLQDCLLHLASDGSLNELDYTNRTEPSGY